MPGPGYLRPGIVVALDVFMHIFTLQVREVVNFSFRLLGKADIASYKLSGQYAQQLKVIVWLLYWLSLQYIHLY